MAAAGESPHYRSFLLIVWEERGQELDAPRVWRFRLENVRDAGGRRVFTTLEEVMQYLNSEIERLSRKGGGQR